MNKLLSLLAVAMIMLGLSACKGSDGGESTPQDAVSSYLQAWKDGDARALINASCDRSGNPVDISEIEEDEINEAAARLAEYSDMEYTVGDAEISADDKKAEVDVTITHLGVESHTKMTCYKDGDGKWRVCDI